MRHYKHILIGLALLFLTACGSLSPLPLEQAKPDPAWTEPTPEPAPPGARDNGALASWIAAWRDALAAANADKAAIRRWSEGL